MVKIKIGHKAAIAVAAIVLTVAAIAAAWVMPYIYDTAGVRVMVHVRPGMDGKALCDTLQTYCSDGFAHRTAKVLSWLDVDLSARCGAYEIKPTDNPIAAARKIRNREQTPVRFTFGNLRLKEQFALRAEQQLMMSQDEIAALLSENNSEDNDNWDLPTDHKPYVILVVGVNGVGKTTTIGKLAYQFKNAGKKVFLGAADTFRAAAVEQLCIWGERVGVTVVKQQMGSDPASVAFDTLNSAKANNADVAIIDTAGRLHNKIGLMNELKKIKDVMKKVLPQAPDEVLLVLDGSTGQNAFEQAKQFAAVTQITSLAITKLDGTAKGGVVIGISDQLKVPVKYIGLGEGMEDLQLFNKRQFVDSLFNKI